MAIITRRGVIAEQPPEHGLPAVSIAMCVITVVVVSAFFFIRWRVWSVLQTELSSPTAPMMPNPQPHVRRGRNILPQALLDSFPVVKFSSLKQHVDDVLNEASDRGSQNTNNSNSIELQDWHPPRYETSNTVTAEQGNSHDSALLNLNHTADTNDANLVGLQGLTQPNPRPATVVPTKTEATQSSTVDGTSDQPCCTVCTDDFEADDDVRMLPCHHTFHQACIDPWLLKKAGTCPVCRVDLNSFSAQSEGVTDAAVPAAAAAAETAGVAAAGAGQVTPAAPQLPAPVHHHQPAHGQETANIRFARLSGRLRARMLHL
ncbi:hypothetical protein B0H63DRAFT_476591 [Podospora didyma]|uniref:RING-type domain-containing protein n=1 Tax=Podospora didyma TaxID=330526 RepID=A0AAE0TW84_9PEZI|nr:hypothetical protein B0H63DRAFT_476591 [Podospora didyma]